MGPRLVGRGKFWTFHGMNLLLLLQWGRVLWDAESGLRFGLVSTGLLLQWGRVLWDAESCREQNECATPMQASMGPRLVGRGKVLADFHPHSAQREASMGPRLVGRGKQSQHLCTISKHIASMGPRLVGRGKDDKKEVQSSEDKASMGPRLVGRGKWSIVFVLIFRSLSFNGAASCGTRKDPRSGRVSSNTSHASMGPRLVGRGKVLAASGRSIGSTASMGPRLVGRGKASNTTETALTYSLQWGRVLWDAERLLFVANGLEHPQASMGPRLVGRGKQMIQDFVFQVVRGLQWGRVLWDAERCRPR